MLTHSATPYVGYAGYLSNSDTDNFEAARHISVLLTQYCAGDKIEKNEMGGPCRMYEGRERCAQGFGGET